jgi:NADPH:quinone reductase-like Zn-dependent oxidoreductase
MKNGNEINRRAALGLGLGTVLTGTAALAAAKPRHGQLPERAATAALRMRAWEVGDRTGELTLRLVEKPVPVPGTGQVLLKVLATGINSIDVAMLRGRAFKVGTSAMVPLQDNVSSVAAIGAGVTNLAVGDRVTTTLYIEWTTGPWNTAYTRSMPGLGIDGFLADYALMPAATLVKVPAHFSNEAACTLAIAGLTAWRALVIEAQVKPGETVVTTGTGGVSAYNLQIAKLFGARVIVTSSSDAKLERMRALGADLTINYRTTPDWAQEVLRLTNGRGADVVLNNVGWPEMVNSLTACGSSARLIHIGASRDRTMMTNWPNMIMKNIWIKSYTMAGREMLEHFMRAMEYSTLKPVVDKVFPFEQAVEAVQFMESGDHIGKVVISHA